MVSTLEIAGENKNADAEHIIASINKTLPPRKIRNLIERLDISAGGKALLMDIAALTIKVGDVLISFGRKVLTVAFEIVSRFPKTAFGVVIAFIVTALIASVPFVGGLLAPFIGPLMVAFGLTVGTLNDMRDESWASRVTELEQQMKMLGA